MTHLKYQYHSYYSSKLSHRRTKTRNLVHFSMQPAYTSIPDIHTCTTAAAARKNTKSNATHLAIQDTIRLVEEPFSACVIRQRDARKARVSLKDGRATVCFDQALEVGSWRGGPLPGLDQRTQRVPRVVLALGRQQAASFVASRVCHLFCRAFGCRGCQEAPRRCG